MRPPDTLTQWLLDHASAPIRYRVIMDILDGGKEDPDVERARAEMLAFPTAQKIISRQQDNGSWGNSIYWMSGHKTTGMKRPYEATLYQLGRLVEYGFDARDAPVDKCAQRVLLPLLDPENEMLWELSSYLKSHPDVKPFLRKLLRDISLRLLCPAGYGDHPLVKDAVTRGLSEIAAFLNHAKEKPLYQEARGKTVMADGLYFPTVHFMHALAHADWIREVPQFNSLFVMYYEFVDVNSPLPDYYILTRKGTLRHGHEAAFQPKEFYLRYPTRMLQELETMARLGTVTSTQYGQWMLDELLAQQDGDGRFRLRDPRKSRSFDYYLLEPNIRGRDIDPLTIDATFRAKLILHYLNYLV